MAAAEGKGRGLMCLVCVSILFGLILGVGGLIGVCLAIWQIIDALHINDELMSLASEVLRDDRLLSATYVFLAFTVNSVCFGGVGGKSKKDGDYNDPHKGTSCCGGIFSLLLIGGYLASGILALQYNNSTLPGIGTAMEDALQNRSYLNPQSNISAPEYSKLGEYFNFLQCKYTCCGVSLSNGTDYINAEFPTRYNLTVPYSCCKLKDKKVDWRQVTRDDVDNYEQCSLYNQQYFHPYTCYSTHFRWLRFKANLLMGYSFVMVAVSLLSGAILFILLACACCCV